MTYTIAADSTAGNDGELDIKESKILFGTGDKTAEQVIVRLISQDGREIKKMRENSRILQSGMQKNMSNHSAVGKKL